MRYLYTEVPITAIHGPWPFVGETVLIKAPGVEVTGELEYMEPKYVVVAGTKVPFKAVVHIEVIS